MRHRENIDDPATWPGEDMPEPRTSARAAASIARSIYRLQSSHEDVLRWLESGQPVPDQILRVALGRMIEGMQIIHQVAIDEAAGATTDAVRDVWALRRQTESAMRESFTSAARSESGADRADGAALVALDAAQRALMIEDRATARAESAARLVVRQELSLELDAVRRLAWVSFGVGMTGALLGLVGMIVSLF